MALRTLLLAMAIPLGCLAQNVTLALSSGVGSPASSVTLAVSLNATGASPSAVQWALQYSTADFSSLTVTAGPAAAESDKTVTCSQTAGTAKCILWGENATPIADGVVANVFLTVSASTLANSSGVQLVNCLAANPAGDPLATSCQGGSVTLLQLINASPNPIPVAPGATVGQTTIRWSAPDSSIVEVHVGSATGTLLAEGGSTGSAQTGDWVGNGMMFVLVDATTRAELAATTVTLAGTSTITASPNPIPAAPGATVGQTTISWSAPGSNIVEVHVGSADGTLFAEGGSTGSSETGDWASNGMLFVLTDGTTHAMLATTTVTLTGSGAAPTITASPNPIPLATGATVGQTTISWNAPGSRYVEVHVGSANGTLFAEGGATGSSQTGDWVGNGMAFVLVDATTHTVLATTTVTQIPP